jgi:hypothetical protein
VPIRPIRELSLRQRLLLLTMLTSGIGLVLGCLGFLVFDMHSAREQKVEDLRSAADLIGTNSTAALAFDDAMGGSRLLAALSTRPKFAWACCTGPMELTLRLICAPI